MRIIIETADEGRILLEPEKMEKTQGRQQEPEAAIDAGPPSEALMNAIGGSAASAQSEELESGEGAEFLSTEEPSPFH